ncbi:MAG: RNase adapter RapZ [Rhodobacteraceae bacterium]|nr:RNase adapter RapZ [Paracoccaceae bacterium]
MTAAQTVVLVTGPSGAGRATAMRALEDLGYETIDNMPLGLVPRLFEGPPIARPVALIIDVRNREFSAAALNEFIDAMTERPDVQLDVLFLDSRDDVLIARFSETRRPHPLAPAGEPGPAIRAERDLLSSVRARADVLIDTSDLTVHELRAEVARHFAREGQGRLALSVQSFSYKRGAPRGLDLMFDCRFLRNPHWDAALRPRDGRDPEVAAYVMADPLWPGFIHRVTDLLLFLLPAQQDEGRAHLAIGFGCTGGRHRSVAVVENVAKALAEAGWQVSKRHREMERRAGDAPDVVAG